ncbi:MAG TPA: heparan-alpha-glucosaminide N-acetyltransferase [Albitalea sp.]|nr:heparan-alpha-glucosaminide N-acetyltransferase [Albitalea sp.]
MNPTSTAALPHERFDRLDALRAVAILWMATFHFCFDLNYFRFIHQNFYNDPFWTVQRACIVSLFMSVAGMGQAVAATQAQSWPRFWRRWRQIAGCAVLVSIGSWLMFRDRFISFGVLHGIAVMLIIVRLSSGWGRWLWLAGAAAIVLPFQVQHPFFDTRLTNWVGLITHKPATEDYAPVLPWLGAMWWGMAAGQWVLAQRRHWLSGPLPRPLHPLAVLGRWSLTFYMVHQPVLLGLLMLVVMLRGAH